MCRWCFLRKPGWRTQTQPLASMLAQCYHHMAESSTRRACCWCGFQKGSLLVQKRCSNLGDTHTPAHICVRGFVFRGEDGQAMATCVVGCLIRPGRQYRGGRGLLCAHAYRQHLPEWQQPNWNENTSVAMKTALEQIPGKIQCSEFSPFCIGHKLSGKAVRR